MPSPMVNKAGRSLIALPILLAAALAAPLGAQTAGTVAGTVVDGETGEPLDGVHVHIPALGIGVLSRDGGRFALSGVPAGTHELRADLIGHLDLTRTVAVEEGETVVLELRLERSVLLIEALVVTGTAFAESPIELPYAVTVTGRRTLAEQGSPQAFDLFRNVTASHGILGARQGWYNTRPPGMVSETVANVNLRGIGASRTLVLLNGRRQVYLPMRLSGGRFVDVNAFPSVALDRVEADAQAHVGRPEVADADEMPIRVEGPARKMGPPALRVQPAVARRLPAFRLRRDREPGRAGRRPDAHALRPRRHAAHRETRRRLHRVDDEVGRWRVHRLGASVAVPPRHPEVRHRERARAPRRAELPVVGDLAPREGRGVVAPLGQQGRPNRPGRGGRPRGHQALAEAARIAEQPVPPKEQDVDRLDEVPRPGHRPPPCAARGPPATRAPSPGDRVPRVGTSTGSMKYRDRVIGRLPAPRAARPLRPPLLHPPATASRPSPATAARPSPATASRGR